MWCKKWPKEEGRYWCYGYFDKNSDVKTLRMVIVDPGYKDFPVYMYDNKFLEEDEVGELLWQKAEVPELPVEIK